MRVWVASRKTWRNESSKAKRQGKNDIYYGMPILPSGTLHLQARKKDIHYQTVKEVRSRAVRLPVAAGCQIDQPRFLIRKSQGRRTRRWPQRTTIQMNRGNMQATTLMGVGLLSWHTPAVTPWVAGWMRDAAQLLKPTFPLPGAGSPSTRHTEPIPSHGIFY